METLHGRDKGQRVRFGAFEVDFQGREITRNGEKVKIQDKPFQILALLVAKPRKLVTREELRRSLWPADTFVDFEAGLNTAIRKLRDALQDEAKAPRFVETVQRHGYRFIAPIEKAQPRDSQPEGASTSSAEIAPNQGAASKWKVAVPVAALALVAAFIASELLWRSRQVPVLSQKSTIVLGDFANSTGDSVFEGTLREGLSVQLEQSPFLSLVSEEEIHQTLRMMGQPADVRLTPQISREVCQRTNSTAALDGLISVIGTRYNLILKAVNCENGDLLASTEAQANDKSHVLDALGSVASEMRRKLGESLTSLQKYNTPLEQATTPSLEALQAYSLGFKATWVSGDQAAALPFLQRATQFDPNFAMAYWAESNAYSSTGESTLAAENIQKAYNLRTGGSQLEKLLIEADYNSFLTGDLIKLRRSAELGAQAYPRESIFHLDLGVAANFLGQYETGLSEYRKALRLSPYNSFFSRLVVFTYLLSNRIEDAAAAAAEAQTKGLDSNLAPILYGIAFYRNDNSEMARQVESASGKPGQEDLVLALEADTAAYFGHVQKARELSHRAADSAERSQERETAATFYAVSALRDALFGDATNARHQAIIAGRRSSGRDLNYACALAFVYAGNLSRARALADGLAKRFPEDTIVHFNYLPALRAKLSTNGSNPQQAIDTLEVAVPYELGLPAFGLYNWPNLYPVYVRGEAYLAAHQGREAAIEFQKILDHRGIVLNEPIGALAHLQLGRAYGISGDIAKAKKAYQDFLTLWKDADPDIPVLKQAKAEYAKLQ